MAGSLGGIGAETVRRTNAFLQAFRGRLFDEDDAAFPGTRIILTHASWQQRFGASESIVGGSVTIGSGTFDVIGVLPPGFLFTPTLLSRDFEIATVGTPWKGLDGGTLFPVVRLETGVTRERAQTEMDTLLESSLVPPDVSLPFMHPVRSVLYPVGRPVMATLLAASGVILLLGCANLAHMFLTRGRQREGETAVRAALGASRLRLIRPVVIEGCVLGATAALLAVAVASVLFDSLLAQVPEGVYGQAPVGVNWRVGIIALALGIAGGIFAGTLNLRRIWGLSLDPLIRRVSPSASPAERGRWMVGVQVALSIVLVFGAGVAAREFVDVVMEPLGFEPENVLMVTVNPEADTGQARQDFYVRAIEEVTSIEGVLNASAAGGMLVGALPVEGARTEDGEFPAGIEHALPGFWETARISVLRGRTPDWNDLRNGGDAAVISESGARALFGNSDPIGKTFTSRRGRRFRVTGVVSDVRPRPGTPPNALAYVIPGPDTGRLFLILRTVRRDVGIIDEVRDSIRSVSTGGTTIGRTEWWSDQIESTAAVRNPRFHTLILGSFGSLALVLTAVGVVAVVGSAVAGRRREIGIRLALGARPERLWTTIVGRITAPVVLGAVVGFVATLWCTSLSVAEPLDTDTGRYSLLFLSVFATVAASGIAASIPARRASHIDPMKVLRTE